MTIHDIKLGEKVYYVAYISSMPEVFDVVVDSFEYKVTKEGTEITNINGTPSYSLREKEFYATKEEAKQAALKAIKEDYEYQLECLNKL